MMARYSHVLQNDQMLVIFVIEDMPCFGMTLWCCQTSLTYLHHDNIWATFPIKNNIALILSVSHHVLYI